MKRYIIFLLCVFATNIIHGDSAIPDQLRSAAALYEQKEYDQASVLLRDIHPKNSVIWYNMGNCAYKKNEYEYALSYWRCAYASASSDVKKHIAYNIDVVEQKMGRSNQTSFVKNIYDAYRSIPLIIFQLFFLLPWFLLLLFIKRYKHGTKYKSLFFVSLLFMTIVSGVVLGFKYHIIKQRRGIVMKHQVSLFAGPDEQYHILGFLDGASEVVVHEQRPSWYKISYKQGSGWLMQDSIVVV